MRPSLPHAFCLASALLLAHAPAFAQTPAPAAPGAPAAPAAPAHPPGPTSPVQSIRNKLSAADLLSAESIAEAWRAQHGADGPWLVGTSWLARGALMLGTPEQAERYADSTLFYVDERLASGKKLADDGDSELALGAAIEVKAQLLARRKGAAAAAEFVRAHIARFPDAPLSFRARLHKRANMLALAGSPAPELVAGDVLRGPAPTLAALRGKPVVLFLFNYGCGDCRGVEPALEHVRARHAKDGLQVVGLTRWYDEEGKRTVERAAMDSTWTATYAGLGDTPVIVSEPSFERYGGSSTPTFVFIDRKGIVRGYAPTRLTEDAFEKAVAAILR